ncbi:MAG: YihY/virulence factor BrkB family protein [Myxococcaceae bacterium]
MSWKEFFGTVKNEYTRDRVSDVAGTLTFFSVLALFPFLLFMVALASVIIDPRTAQSLIEQLGQVAPGEVTQILGERIRALGEANSVGLLTFGAVAAFYSAARGIRAAMRALNVVYGVKETRPLWKVYGIAFLMTLGAAGLGIVAVAIAVVAPAAASALGGVGGTLIEWLRLPVAGLLMMLLWAVLYYFLPDVEQRFRYITPGSVVGVIVWMVASWGFSLYVSRFGKFDATYGALGGVIVLLLWMWISSQVLLLGAEINAVIEVKSPGGKPIPKASKTEVEQAAAPVHERVAMTDRRKSERRKRGSLLRDVLRFATAVVVLVGLTRLADADR